MKIVADFNLLMHLITITQHKIIFIQGLSINVFNTNLCVKKSIIIERYFKVVWKISRRWWQDVKNRSFYLDGILQNLQRIWLGIFLISIPELLPNNLYCCNVVPPFYAILATSQSSKSSSIDYSHCLVMAGSDWSRSRENRF